MGWRVRGAVLLSILLGSLGSIALLGLTLSLVLHLRRLIDRQEAFHTWVQLQRSLQYWSLRDSHRALEVVATDPALRGTVALVPTGMSGVALVVSTGAFWGILVSDRDVRPGPWPVRWVQPPRRPQRVYGWYGLPARVRGGLVSATVDAQGMVVLEVLERTTDRLPAGTRIVSVDRIAYALVASEDGVRLFRRTGWGQLLIADHLNTCGVDVWPLNQRPVLRARIRCVYEPSRWRGWPVQLSLDVRAP